MGHYFLDTQGRLVFACATKRNAAETLSLFSKQEYSTDEREAQEHEQNLRIRVTMLTI